ncbi:hypothetical protein TUM4438_46200 [Shewanella sairae]|uniref:Plasmid pRiA4b Orf3-like domain-containing protein n=1 Tax=Shewanella sairae TaxID=190310 RepID=A0ABQ4PRZ2_9GAMM|nr:plasmid pRiA4b ORF-3 family protein [Shewanella sairae]MCL1132591.1 plasmid pRiA4b ORF-3 family protein [Shewanella sairae]GIU52759.1 hypothetical protein TUM4438_46200 [Shewanella sairae]
MGVLPLRHVYQLHVSLNDIEPAIWRRILVPSEVTLDVLHLLIQKAMGWQDEHLHQFIAGSKLYSDYHPDWDEFGADFEDESTVRIRHILTSPNQTLTYTYDFGDNWQHTIRLEEIKSPDDVDGEQLCIAGERACPPENCGSVPGYYQLLEIMADPEHRDYEDTLFWLGGNFDPDFFSLDVINSFDESSMFDAGNEFFARIEAQEIVMNQLLKTLKNTHPETYHHLHKACMQASKDARSERSSDEGRDQYTSAIADTIDSFFDFDEDGTRQVH